MVEKKLQVCDVCEEKVSKHSCEVCNSDLCGTCAKRLPLLSTPDETVLMRVCKNCLTKVKSLLDDTRFTDKIIKDFGDLVRSSNILEELEEDDE